MFSISTEYLSLVKIKIESFFLLVLIGIIYQLEKSFLSLALLTTNLETSNPQTRFPTKVLK